MLRSPSTLLLVSATSLFAACALDEPGDDHEVSETTQDIWGSSPGAHDTSKTVFWEQVYERAIGLRAGLEHHVPGFRRADHDAADVLPRVERLHLGVLQRRRRGDLARRPERVVVRQHGVQRRRLGDPVGVWPYATLLAYDGNWHVDYMLSDFYWE